MRRTNRCATVAEDMMMIARFCQRLSRHYLFIFIHLRRHAGHAIITIRISFIASILFSMLFDEAIVFFARAAPRSASLARRRRRACLAHFCRRYFADGRRPATSLPAKQFTRSCMPCFVQPFCRARFAYNISHRCRALV